MCMHVQTGTSISLISGPGIGVMWLLMPLGMLLCVVVIAAISWLLIRMWRTSTRSSVPSMQYPHYYEQGDHTKFPDAPTSRNGRQDGFPPSSSYEQPQAQYPEMPGHR